MSLPPGSPTPPETPPASTATGGTRPNGANDSASRRLWDHEGVKLLAVVGAILGAMVLLAGVSLTGTMATGAATYDADDRPTSPRKTPRSDGGPSRGGRDFGNPGGQRDDGDLGGLGGLSGLRGNLELFSSLQHGDVVVTGPSGQPETKRIARGTISAVTPTSLSVTSADGFVTAYTLGTATTIMINGRTGSAIGLKVGQNVSVIGTATGAAASADQVIATTA